MTGYLQGGSLTKTRNSVSKHIRVQLYVNKSNCMYTTNTFVIKIMFRINKYSQVFNTVSTNCAAFTKFKITNQYVSLSEKVVPLILLILIH
jgi:hypothetical protein